MQISAQLIDVESTQTLRVETVVQQGAFVSLLNTGTTELARKLAGEGAAATAPPRAAGTGSVFVSSQPTGGTIALDGQPLGKSTDVLLQDVPAGKHMLTVTKDNLSGTTTFTLERDQLQKLTVALSPIKATLLVSSTPFGATVTLDGKAVGQTPVQVQTTAGQHRVALTLDGYFSATRELTTKPGQRNEVAITLQASATLRVTGLATGRIVQVDGQTVQPDADGNVLLKPGSHQVSASQQGFRRREEQVTLVAGKTTTFNAGLLPLTGYLTVTGVPGDDTVTLVDSQGASTVVRGSVQRQSLPVGTYSVSVSGSDIGDHNLGPFQIIDNYESKVRVTPEQLAQWRSQMPVTLHMTGLTAGRAVRVDGQTVQPDFDGNLQLKAGPHKVSVSEEGFRPREEQVTLQPGQTTTFDASLQRQMGYLTVSGVPDNATVTIDDPQGASTASTGSVERRSLPAGAYGVIVSGSAIGVHDLGSAEVTDNHETQVQVTPVQRVDWRAEVQRQAQEQAEEEARREREDAEQAKRLQEDIVAKCRYDAKYFYWEDFKAEASRGSFFATSAAIGYPIGLTIYAPALLTSTTVKLHNCDKESAGRLLEQYRFVAANYDQVRTDAARGGGQYANSLASLMGCPAPLWSALGRAEQRSFARIDPPGKAEPWRLLVGLKHDLTADPRFAQGCAYLQ